MSSSFDSTLSSLKRRMLLLGGALGASWGAVIAAASVLVAVWVDLLWELSPETRILSVAAAAMAGAMVVATCISRAAAASRAPVIARRLDEVGATGGEILSGLELSSFSGSGSSALLSQGLAEIAVRRAAEVASRIPADVAASIQPLKKAVLAALAIAAGLTVLTMTASRLAATEWLRFSDPFGDHPPYSRTQLLVEPGDARVRYGDGLNVVATVEGPAVEELELVLNRDVKGQEAGPPERLPMFPESPTRWKATLSSVTDPGSYTVRARGTRSHRYKIEIITVPQIERVRFRITPPTYTRDAVYEGPLPKGGVTGLPGTVVEVRAQSNRPLSAGAVELTLGSKKESVALSPAGGESAANEVVGSWTISEAGTFRLTVKDVEGQESRDSFSGSIATLRDQTPFVRVMEPPSQSLATPSAVVPVTMLAEDDYGITRLQLFRSLNDSRGLPLSIPTGNPPQRRQDGAAALLLPAYGVEPGDVIKLFARAEDNDPAGAKGSESPIAVIQIVSDEEFSDLLRARDGMESLFSKYQEAQRRLEALQDEVDQLMKELEKKDGELSPEDQQKLEQLAEQVAKEAEAIEKSADRPQPIDLDRALTAELQKLAKSMKTASEEVKQGASQQGLSAKQSREQLEKLKDSLAGDRQQLKEGVNDPLDQLAAIYPLVEDQARYLELYYRQRDLAERLASLKGSESVDDPDVKIRMRELEAEQHKIQQDLGDLLADIESHATQLPEGDEQIEQLRTSSLEFVKALRESEADEAMTLAAGALAEFSGTRGHEEAKRAADILESFLSKCKNCSSLGEGACKGLKFSPGEGALGNSLSQMLAGMGLNPGQMGAGGAGGGFSARRGGMNNVGLYGQLPARGNPTQSQGGRGNRSSTAGRGRQSEVPALNSSPFAETLSPTPGGATDAAVPAAYRRRVEEYFQRIADEAAGTPKGGRP
jgi:hypothetical protein